MIDIQIEGEKVSTLANQNVFLQYSALDLQSLGSKLFSYSSQITLPVEPNANIFDNKHKQKIADKFINNESNATIFSKSRRIMEGTFTLQETNSREYRGRIYSNTRDWLRNITGNIEDISFDLQSYPSDSQGRLIQSMRDYNAASLTDRTIVFPFYTRGTYNSAYHSQPLNDIQNDTSAPFMLGTNFRFDDLIPCVSYMYVLRQIFNEVGIGIECTLFEDSDFQRLIIPYTNSGNFAWNYGAIGGLDYNVDINNNLTRDTDYLGNKTLQSIVVDYDGIATDARNVPLGNVLRWIAPTDGRIQCTAVDNELDVFNVATVIYHSSDQVNKIYDADPNFYANLNGRTRTVTLDVSQGDSLYIFYLPPFPLLNPTDQRQKVSANIRYIDKPTQINPGDILPTGISKRDFIKDFFNMFGLHPFYSPETNVLYALSFDDFVLKTNHTITNVTSETDKEAPATLNDFVLRLDTADALETAESKEGTPLLFARSYERVYRTTNFNQSPAVARDQNIIQLADSEGANVDRYALNIETLIDFVEFNPDDRTVGYPLGAKVARQLRFFERFQFSQPDPDEANSGWLALPTFGNPQDNYNADNYYDTGATVVFEGRIYVKLLEPVITDPVNNPEFVEVIPGDINGAYSFENAPRLLSFDRQTQVRGSDYVEIEFIRDSIVGTSVSFSANFRFALQKCFFDEDFLGDQVRAARFYRQLRPLLNRRSYIKEIDAILPPNVFNEIRDRIAELNYNNDTFFVLGVSKYNTNTGACRITALRKLNVNALDNG